MGTPTEKSYRAIRHDVVRQKQSSNAEDVHHPKEKINQIRRCLKRDSIRILELFAGQGNLTKIYEQYGTVDAYDLKFLKTGDSYLQFHRLIWERKKYNLIDLDPYGFPNRFFPDIFLLFDTKAVNYLFITMPKPYVNILNGITQAHLSAYYGTPKPDEKTIIARVQSWGLCHWYQVALVESLDLGRLWRMCFSVVKVKATDYTGVRNR